MTSASPTSMRPTAVLLISTSGGNGLRSSWPACSTSCAAAAIWYLSRAGRLIAVPRAAHAPSATLHSNSWGGACERDAASATASSTLAEASGRNAAVRAGVSCLSAAASASSSLHGRADGDGVRLLAGDLRRSYGSSGGGGGSRCLSSLAATHLQALAHPRPEGLRRATHSRTAGLQASSSGPRW